MILNSIDYSLKLTVKQQKSQGVICCVVHSNYKSSHRIAGEDSITLITSAKIIMEYRVSEGRGRHFVSSGALKVQWSWQI